MGRTAQKSEAILPLKVKYMLQLWVAKLRGSKNLVNSRFTPSYNDVIHNSLTQKTEKADVDMTFHTVFCSAKVAQRLQ